MKRFVSVLPAALLLGSSMAAQTGDQPTLVFTIFGGVTAGHSLWSVGGQPYCSAAMCNPTTPHDTFQLSRDITSSITGGLGATYFPHPHIGFLLEVFYLGLSFEDHCRDVSSVQDPRNAEICTRANSSQLSTSAVGFFGEAVLRGAPRGPVSPYLRGGFGLTTYSGGTVDMTSCFVDAGGNCQQQALLVDTNPKSSGLSLQIAAGFTFALGPGYQARFDVRDVVVPLEEVTGPAGPTLVPPKATRYFHHFALTVGLNVILERKRGRRY